jgi:L-seryl-tRNA(Ser) seleniumtransferase
MVDAPKNAALRRLPSIDELLSQDFALRLLQIHARSLVADAARRAVGAARQRILEGREEGAEAVEVRIGERELRAAVEELCRPHLRKVLNATGVILHTNLGRAPLADEALRRISEVAGGYSNLELDLAEGERGSRYAPVEESLRMLTGAEASVVVNNCAGAVLLALSALASGREVIVSRGEAVEIGGGFRIPDVMRQSGARLVEVGTTNKTRLEDYEQAVGPATALILKVHRSNFAIVGFTEEASTSELSQLGSVKSVPLFEDLGSGGIEDLLGAGFAEPTVSAVVRAGADLVSFSGDKLLGGPQAGILVGRADLIRTIRQHPLNRALRVDKLTLAALEATLDLYRQGRSREIPLIRMMSEPLSSVKTRAETLARQLANQGIGQGLGIVEVVESEAQVGGGSLPLATPGSWAVCVTGINPELLASKLRAGVPAVLGRVARGALWLDTRCIHDAEVETLSQAVGRAAVLCAAPEGQG